ncbi:hypothetical protein BV898_19373 [Hypsibius exemplaris]|uniref:Uncharacterized protein n=1 Tax=Hypsibius exemplaris TaxID=2072580 RepID=A0A9X6NQL3_HYPEX|nr:hypothetical protein BV898_19373 [Hypsibius exemplaris]
MFHGDPPEDGTLILVPDVEPDAFWILLRWAARDSEEQLKHDFLRLGAGKQSVLSELLHKPCRGERFAVTFGKMVFSPVAAKRSCTVGCTTGGDCPYGTGRG